MTDTKPSILEEFKAFITRGNVMDLAVGVIIGAAFTSIVDSLVKDIFSPLIGLATGKIDFSDLFVSLDAGSYANLTAARTAGAPVIAYGLFLNAIIKFLIVALVVFFLVRQINKLLRTQKAVDAFAAPPRQEVLLQEIRDAIRQKPNV